MATIFVNRDNDSIAFGAVAAYNQFHDQFVKGGIAPSGATGLSPTGYFHRDITSVVATGADWQHPLGAPLTLNPVGATGATLLNQTLYNQIMNIRGVLLDHFNDDSAHVVKDTTNATGLSNIALPVSASDYTGMPFLLNNERTFFNAHLTQVIPTGSTTSFVGNPYGPIGPVQVHVINDTVNTVNTATAVGTGSMFALAGALASGITAHLANGFPIGRLKVLPP